MGKNNKGFTLIELMAVVIVLIIIIFIAIIKVNKSVDETRENTIIANAGMYIKAANGFVSGEAISDPTYEEGYFTVSELEQSGVKISGTKPNSGYIYVYDSEVYISCLVYDDYYIDYSSGNMSKPKEGNCPTFEAINNFEYTGHQEIFNVQNDATYKLEVWGAQGGNINDIYYGGYGGYSVGYVKLKKGDKLYVNVGGAGVINGAGGYNGGGNSTLYNSGSGGGATSIATKSGQLSTLSGDIDKILIVAGGGGGSKYYGDTSSYSSTRDYSGSGGSGGGAIGAPGIASTATVYGVGLGGSQTMGGYTSTGGNGSNSGLFGKGVSTNGYSGSGSGAGFYGGGTLEHGPAGGGSGYVGNKKLFNGVMYCYGCNLANNPKTKTVPTVCTDENPTENCAKKLNGYARISLAPGGNSSPTNNNVTYFAYTGSAQTFTVKKSGNYKIELWGAAGGERLTAPGAYTSGIINLNSGDNLYIYVGQQSSGNTATFNGGGSCGSYCSAGGGATDVRLVNGNWNDTASLRSRIMVAAGGAGYNSWKSGYKGGSGGALSGVTGSGDSPTTGGTQTSAGVSSGNDASKNGSFGIGGNGENYGGGGSGGYWGGAAGKNSSTGNGGSSGSSYISGHTGCVAIVSADSNDPRTYLDTTTNQEVTCQNDTTVNECSRHYSGKVFTETVIKSGSQTMPNYEGTSNINGNSEPGFAKITYLGN